MQKSRVDSGKGAGSKLMNKEWSELNKTMQEQLKKEITFYEGLGTLLSLRNSLFSELLDMKKELNCEEFSAIPFLNADGYHSKTIAYSIWHIFRIEDIVAHTLIGGDKQVFFSENYQERIRSPILTTGNELIGLQIAEFSKQLDLETLYQYAADVKASTEELLGKLPYQDLKKKFGEEDKERLRALQVVSADENASWLIDYWCGKNIRGLIQMPFSRHWIMHIEASLRIKKKIHLAQN